MFLNYSNVLRVCLIVLWISSVTVMLAGKDRLTRQFFLANSFAVGQIGSRDSLFGTAIRIAIMHFRSAHLRRKSE